MCINMRLQAVERERERECLSFTLFTSDTHLFQKPLASHKLSSFFLLFFCKANSFRFVFQDLLHYILSLLFCFTDNSLTPIDFKVISKVADRVIYVHNSSYILLIKKIPVYKYSLLYMYIAFITDLCLNELLCRSHNRDGRVEFFFRFLERTPKLLKPRFLESYSGEPYI